MGLSMNGAAVKAPPAAKPSKTPEAPNYAAHLGNASNAKVVKSAPAVAHVTTEKKSGKEVVLPAATVHETVLSSVPTDDHRVVVNGGRTVNLGDYNSARFDVGITVPCTKDTLEDAYEFGSGWVDGKIKEIMDLVK